MRRKLLYPRPERLARPGGATRLSSKRTSSIRIIAALLGFLLLPGCDDDESGESEAGFSQPSSSDVFVGSASVTEAAANLSSPSAGIDSPTGRNADLSILGGQASQNQQAFRQRFGLADPSPKQLANWQPYNARLTAYSNQDIDWPFPTAAFDNWLGSTWNGDPLAVEGTTVAVDFSRIPRGSLLYIPSLAMYAEANDTGAASQWAQTDSGLSDYGPQGVGRIDVYNLADGRSSAQVERNFENRVGSREFGQIYIVSRGSGWKQIAR